MQQRSVAGATQTGQSAGPQRMLAWLWHKSIMKFYGMPIFTASWRMTTSSMHCST